ncbi:MAG: hypothetical protein ACREHC_07620 [Candidatus Levyibacteriota bacterium]
MARGDNLTEEDRAKGGKHSHSGGRSKSAGSKGGRSLTSRRGLASASKSTRERVAREGGKA